MIIFVLDDVEKFPAVIEAWQKIGCPGITVHETTGLGRIIRQRDDLPLMPSLRSLFESSEESHRTIWAVVPDGFDIDALFDATENIVGKLSLPDNGIIFALPIAKVRGLRSQPT
jgi:hypothetical protein